MKRYLLELTVFICGAVVMILEILGSRVLAPYLGTSIVVWTSLIGIILASLSFGYWYGGRLADRYPSLQIFSLLIFLAGLSTGLVFFSQSLLLAALYPLILDLRIGATLAALILFSIPSFLLGMVSPYAVRLRISDMNTSGRTVGSLYAISTVGSIVGTFLTGFFLLQYFGTSQLIALLAVILMLTSLMVFPQHLFRLKLIGAFFFFLSLLFVQAVQAENRELGYIDVDTAYNRVLIYEDRYPLTGEPIRRMRLNNEASSARSLLNNDLVFPYIRFFRLAQHFTAEMKQALLIGGAGYSYPMDFLSRFPQARMDVVEIDPGLTALAKQYFSLQENPRLNIFHEDARTFFRRSETLYDAIFLDAFHSNAPPFQLTTREFVQEVYDDLSPDGVVMVNIISALEGEKGQLFKAMLRTYQSVFPQLMVLPVTDPSDPYLQQNIILVALKSDPPRRIIALTNEDPELNQYLQHRFQPAAAGGPAAFDGPILTDDFAPIEYYAAALF